MRPVGLGVLLLLASSPTQAQLQRPPEDPELDYWFDVFYPKLFYTPTEGLAVGAYLAVIQPLRSRDFVSPPPYRVSFSIDGQLATSGSRFLRLEARAPAVARGWRLTARFLTRRRTRDNYFGLGNATTFDGDNVTDAQPNFYRANRTVHTARAEIQRELFWRVRALAGLNFERWRITPLDGPSVLASDFANGTDPTIGVSTNDMSFRAGIVLDTRDDEVAPRRGVLVESIYGVADASVLGDLTYTRLTLSGRGFLTVTSRLQFAGRLVAQVMGGTPRFGSYHLVEGADRFYSGLGGSGSHRALRDNRLLGRDKLLANFETRYAIFAIPTLYRFSVMAFVDAGRVFEADDFELTTKGLKVGGGGGLFLQIGRAGVAGFTAGIGPDGLTTDFHTRWTF